eukprot:TRINITY_DN7738_c0_g2_i1.p1 TRINITY_DN7738_c0_g2~~TRINITY_DN7738_c0_g2_i1.p1  ORF type:complete len:229 (-),score=41.10 TRINITY_DN7738_c0_g2_i1:116-802(-)
MISWVTHDTQLYRFKVPGKNLLPVPVGHHVTIVHKKGGTELNRSYTPINIKPGSFEVLVKTYLTGNMSEWLSTLEVGDTIQMRGPYGSWEYKPNFYKRICMYAAGSGLTPMYQVLSTIDHDPKDRTAVVLLFANKESRDILFKKKLDMWEKSGKNVKIFHLLSRAQPTKTNEGYLYGRINRELIESHVEPVIRDEKEFHLICGPDGFVGTTQTLLLEMGVMPEQIHVF